MNKESAKEKEVREDLEFIRDSLPKLVEAFMREQAKELKKIVEGMENTRGKID